MTSQALLPGRFRDGEVLAIVKSPGMTRPASMSMPSSFTVAESLDALLSRPIKSDDDRRSGEHLRREIAGPHNFFVLNEANRLIEVKPETKLAEVAVPRELRFPDGSRQVPCVAVEVVQYASVGSNW